ncbi:MAG: methyltransferase [Candidatus Competibacteraceae bacterium]|nr:methyltransferase [Candidatus Competibacteraceae bacterium]
MNSFVKRLVQEASQSPLALFTREICANPRSMGAACPSSPGLARNMAAQVPLAPDGLVVEVGAGTGVITQALISRGVNLDRLIVVERAAALAGHLRRRFPGVRVIQGDAMELIDLLGSDGAEVRTVVSGLPLRSLDPPVTRAIGDQLDALLGNQGLLVQFTYNLLGSYDHLPPRFQRVASKIIWGNLPPARIDVFRRQLDLITP